MSLYQDQSNGILHAGCDAIRTDREHVALAWAVIYGARLIAHAMLARK